MTVTIKDVAKKANVSIATVSYAINGSARISEKTRD
ncbi:LacI family DNA-binding transcriptional regulator, partial [Vibrio sp. D173a]